MLTRTSIKRTFAKSKLTLDTINKDLVEASYAVRGKITVEAADIKSLLKKGVKYPFSEVVETNIGNP